MLKIDFLDLLIMVFNLKRAFIFNKNEQLFANLLRSLSKLLSYFNLQQIYR
jgi:hypothetical protein